MEKHLLSGGKIIAAINHSLTGTKQGSGSIILMNQNVSPEKAISPGDPAMELMLSKSLQQVFTQAPAAIAVLHGPDMVFTVANEKYQQLVSKSTEDLIGRRFEDVFPEIEDQGYHTLFRNVFASGEPFVKNEYPGTFYKQGVLVTGYYNFTIQPIKDSEGKVTDLMVHAVEVTELVQARKDIEAAGAQLQESQKLIQKNEAYFRALVSATSDVVFRMSADWSQMWALEGQGFLSSTGEAIANWMDKYIPRHAQQKVKDAITRAIDKKSAFEFEHPVLLEDGRLGWTFSRAVPILDATGNVVEWFGAASDVTRRKRFEALSTGQREALELALNGAPLTKVLESIVASAETQSQHRLTASILLLDDDGKRLLHGAAPSLPDDYNKAIHGLKIGPEVGSCGTAAFLGKEVIVSDIQTDPLWKNFKTLAGQYNLRSCWSSPIFSSEGRVLGTFAMYYPDVHTPSSHDREVVRLLSPTAGIVIEWYQEIEERKKAEEALAYQKQLLESVTENTASSLFLLDEKRQCIYMNEAAEEMTGFRFKDMEGRVLHDAIHYIKPDGSPYPVEECPLLQALPGHQRNQGEEVFVHRDGSFYPVYFTASPIIVNGKEKGTVVEVKHIGDEKKRQRDLVESEQRLSLATEAGELGTWDLDLTTDTAVRSLRHDQIFGYAEPVEVWGSQVFMSHIHPEDQEAAKKGFEDAFTSGKLYLELRIYRRDGELRWINAQGRVIYNENNQPVRMLGVVADITERKSTELDLERRVEERTQELNRANQALQRSNEDLQQFAHVASHDLKEPVRKVSTFGSRLRDEFGDKMPERAMTYLQKIESATSRMTTMIDGVLLYSSMNAVEKHDEPVNLNQTIQHIAVDLEVLIGQKKATIKYKNLPTVHGSPILLYQLFYNLVNNSLKFSREDALPVVEITANTVSDKPNLVEIVLQDNGIGFDQKDAELIFQTFSRLHPKDRYEGTGLGLTLCKKIVERHGGTIYAEGIEGTGARFVIRLPLGPGLDDRAGAGVETGGASKG